MSALKAEVLANFRTLTGVPVARVTRTGHDHATLRYTLALDDGRELRISDDGLWSHTEFARETATRLARRVHPCKPATWRTAIEALVIHATDIVDTPGETLEDTVLDWLRTYAGRVTTDRNGAAAAGAPFIDDGELFIAASDFVKYIRREYTEQIKLHEVRQALRDLGFVQKTVSYDKTSGRKTSRSSVSYYRGDIAIIESGDSTP